MKPFIALLGLLILATSAQAQSVSPSTQKPLAMKMNAGVITAKLAETKAFYTQVLGFGVSFENEFYLLLHTPNQQAEISFLLPQHPTQQPIFAPAFTGQGVYLTLEVPNVDLVYAQVKAKGVPINFELRDEPWGDRHFAIVDPNGIGIDVVQSTPPADK
ncbi:MAG: VOC family protein [Bernardetiaceae bacterium]|jgi:catechol 2,3-dioxygenase-like lactoylglutathione lyase family enzyme|nr:VOC family protein [Bernardetiaceae bacterium]